MKIRGLLPFLCILAATFTVLTSEPVHATTIDPVTLEQLASQASFVGIVECETAGGIVAQYRVIESWKGAPVGTRFNLKTEVNYWEPQFPIDLVGQRSVITAFANKAPSRIMSTISGGGVPLWWRDIPYDYSLPLFQGRAGASTTPGHSYYGFGNEYPGFADFRAYVKKFLSLSPEQREVTLMRSLFVKYSGWREKSQAKTSEIKALNQRIATATTAAQIANALLTLRWKDRNAVITPALEQGGGAATLKFLMSLKVKQWPFDKSRRKYVIDSIQSRLAEQKRQASNEAPEVPQQSAEMEEQTPVPTPAKLKKMREVLKGNAPSGTREEQEFGEAIEALTKRDPAIVAQYLVRWKTPDKYSTDQGYFLGSYFAWQCGGERAIYLRALLKAQDPYIRVAGAVYLCFEDQEAGMAELKKLVVLPGDPGVWAALNLARRGVKTVMPRVLKVLATGGDGSMSGVPHRNLQKRLFVLLSNSAKQSGVPQPFEGFVYPKSDDETVIAKSQSAFITKWWQKHHAKVTLSDPWLPLLEKQKID